MNYLYLFVLKYPVRYNRVLQPTSPSVSHQLELCKEVMFIEYFRPLYGCIFIYYLSKMGNEVVLDFILFFALCNRQRRRHTYRV